MSDKIFSLKFNKDQKQIFYLLILSGFCDGISEGILILQETIALKALNATKFQVSLISIIMFSTLIFSLFFTSFLKGKPKTKTLLIALIGGRLIFVFSFLIKSTNIYLIFLFLFYTTYSISFPVINMFYQKHFPYKRGVVFGVYRMILMLLTMIISITAGKILDFDPYRYKVILFFVGIFSSISFLSLILIDKKTVYENNNANSKYIDENVNRDIKEDIDKYLNKDKDIDMDIDLNKGINKDIDKGLNKGIYKGLNKDIDIDINKDIKKDEKINNKKKKNKEIKSKNKSEFFNNIGEIFKEKDFLVFEMLFMTYGFGFMIIQPAIPVYLINNLGFSYTQMAYAKGVFAMIVRTLLFPFAGILFDKVKPWRVGTFSYFVIIIFPLLLILSKDVANKVLFVYLGFSFFSLALTGLSFMWNLGSIYFARNKESSTFQGFHVTLTGIRGLLGPLLGYFLLSLFGVMFNFYFAIVLFFIAGVGTIIYKWEKN